MAVGVPAKPQEGSRLFKIPTEIRLIILRKMLVWGVLEDRSILGYTRFRHQIESINLNVLLTCRRLCDEGRTILYNENTLSIRVISPELNYLFLDAGDNQCHILNGQFDMPSRIQDVHKGNMTIMDITGSDGGSGPRRIHIRCPALLKFKHVELSISVEDPESLYVSCQVLAPILQGKEVTLRRVLVDDQADVDSGIDLGSTEDRMLPRRVMGPCQALRCKSFKVVDMDVPDDILAVIQGHTPVPQLFECWVQFHQAFRKATENALIDDTSCFFDQHTRQVAPVCKAMLEFDKNLFPPLLGNLARTAVQWIAAAAVIVGGDNKECKHDLRRFVEAAEHEVGWLTHHR